MRTKWIIAAVLAVATLGSLAFIQDAEGPAEGNSAGTAAGSVASTDQPIAFPHDIHAGQYQMDCRYCHFSADRSVDAGIPPVATCMGCHNVIPGQNNPQEVEKLRNYWNEGQAIPWVRIYKVADHVHFPHMRHVNAGVDCTECHGQVQEMGVIQEVAQPLSMGWCIECHRENEARIDCTVCHY